MVDLYPDEVTDDLLPDLPTIPQGIWSYLLSVDIRPGLYDELSRYLMELAGRCSLDNVLVVYFQDFFTSPASYEEQWSDLHRKQCQVRCWMKPRGGWTVGELFVIACNVFLDQKMPSFQEDKLSAVQSAKRTERFPLDVTYTNTLIT